MLAATVKTTTKYYNPTLGHGCSYHDGWPTVSITPRPGSCVIVAAAVIDIFHAESSSWMSGAGWTTLHQGHDPDGHPYQANLYKSISNPSGAYTPNGTFDDAPDGGWPITWAMAAVAIPSIAAAPVQSVYAADAQATLPASPTAGNLILLTVWLRDFWTYGGGGSLPVPYPDDDGWEFLEETGAHKWDSAGADATDAVVIFARCVGEGDGNTYGVVGGGDGAPSVSLSEWTVTGRMVALTTIATARASRLAMGPAPDWPPR